MAIMISSLPAEYALDQGIEQEATLSGEDSLLIQRLQKRDAAAFDLLFQHYQRMVRRVAFQFLGDREDAADVTQEVFLRVYQNIDHFKGSSSLKTWIYRIVVNSSLNRRRWWKRRRQDLRVIWQEDSERDIPGNGSLSSPRICPPTPEQHACRRELVGRLQEALAHLPVDQRMPVILRDLEGMSYEEVASVLLLSPGTVKSRIARGREALRRELESYFRCGTVSHPALPR
jgi:RNA polymerase sigma-70 factor, ECF subfamily